jgi:hypothetical protein
MRLSAGRSCTTASTYVKAASSGPSPASIDRDPAIAVAE